jgi:hypothetical protein
LGLGILLGYNVGLTVGTIVGTSGAGVVARLGFKVGAIVPSQEPITFQASLQFKFESPGTSPKLLQKRLMHSYIIPSEEIVDPMSYDPRGSNVPGQPPINMMGCSVGVIVVEGVSVDAMDGS